MSKIRVLSDHIANQIAAGEVVERPASVAKELVENAIDASARRIEIDVEAGGRRLLRVADDGEGMTRDDAVLAFERHATSKISTTDDLSRIATLGFRGEALASIASVARVELITHVEGEAEATRVLVEGGRMRDVVPAARSRGTTLAVRDLFFNVPARRKFLRSEATESYHLMNLVTHYALAHPEIEFVLTNNGREALRAAPAADLRERAYQIFGADFLDNLLEVGGAGGETHRGQFAAVVRGYVSAPRERRTSRDAQYLFVNGRFVRDRLISRALGEGFRTVLPPGVYPSALIFLEVPLEEVDVNVHPAKTEVRFRRAAAVSDAVREAVRTALSTGGYVVRPAGNSPDPVREEDGGPVPLSPDAFRQSLPARGEAEGEISRPDAADFGHAKASPGESRWEGLDRPAAAREQSKIDFGRIAPAQTSSDSTHAGDIPATSSSDIPNGLPPGDAGIGPSDVGGRAGPSGVDIGSGVGVAGEVLPPKSGADESLRDQATTGVASAHPALHSPATTALSASVQLPPLTSASGLVREARDATLTAGVRLLGQLADSFIVAADAEGLLLIDQHLAHERILFDNYRQLEHARPADSQHLLVPETFDLTPAQAAAFELFAPELETYGFGLMRLSGRTVAIKAVPADLPPGEARHLLAEIFATLDSSKRNAARHALRDQIARSLACRAAIKSRTPLAPEKLRWLVERLLHTSSPTTCPHGRPIILRLSLRDLEKGFQRY